jgi:hypothetical protein
MELYANSARLMERAQVIMGFGLRRLSFLDLHLKKKINSLTSLVV